MRGGVDTNPIPILRVWLTYGAIASLLVVFVARLYQLQIVQGPDFVTAATDNRLETVNIPPRGASSTTATARCWSETSPRSTSTSHPPCCPTARRRSRPSTASSPN